MWIDETVDVAGTEVRFKGATDPAIVTSESEPLVVTEVKTKSSLDGLSSPNRHHRAQVHAYMHGLTQEYDRDVEEAVIIYGSRTSLDIRAFHEPFDPEFWSRVLEWASDHTALRRSDELPAASPEYDWECKFCSFKHRCGKSDKAYSDEPPAGLLPFFGDYPREQVVEYLRSHDQPLLTPTLAREYPELATEYPVHQWQCSRCQTEFDWDAVEWEGNRASLPVCSTCASNGELGTLRVTSPRDIRGEFS